MSAGSLPHSLASMELHRTRGPHHGLTLLMLGRAAEHLADSRRFAFGQERAVAPVEEAIHLLRVLSRGVFEEYAGMSDNKTIGTRESFFTC
jgi:hypothetical protein